MIFLRFALLTFAVLLLAAPAMAQETSPLRKFVWGATPEEVRKMETGTFYKTEGTSDFYLEPFENFYKPEFYRIIRYDFKDGKLWRGEYAYDQLHQPDPQLIFQRAADFQLAIEKLYGKPTKEQFIWKNQKYRKIPNMLGAALRNGHVELRTLWELPGTQVVMRAYNDGVLYQLSYTAEKLEAAKKDDETNILGLPVDGKTTP